MPASQQPEQQNIDNQATETPQTTPDFRSPTANVTYNSNANPRWPRKYGTDDKVWVWRETERRYYQAVVVEAHWMNNGWSYYLKDNQGEGLWRDRVTLIEEANLSRFG